MKSQGSLVPVGLIALALGMGAGCKKDETPKPDPAVTAQSTATLPNKGPQHGNRRENAFGRADPQANKDYRIDICYYGTLSLRQVRDSYLASLGKDEPSAKKIPSFGAPATPGSSPSGKPPTPPVPPRPAAAGVDAGAHPPFDRRADFMRALPHERNARACTAALTLKEPPMGDADTALAAYAPFVVELAKDVSAAQQYYQHEEYSKDSFAKGKELNKKLRDEFEKFDDLSGKLGAALVAWRKEHPLDASKMDDSEKLGRAAIDDARDAYVLIATKKADGEAWKAALDKLDHAVDALKKLPDAPTSWAKILGGPLDAFLKTAKESKVTDKTFDADGFIMLVNNFTSLIEARQRAVSRLSRPPITSAPPQPGQMVPPGQAAQPGQPPPAQPTP